MDGEDDVRTGRLLKLLRTRAKLTQAELAVAANVPRIDVIGVERGEAGDHDLSRLRRMFVAVGARGRFGVWWNGAAADRLLDERHAALVEVAVRTMQRRGWTTGVEVSFSEYGERGSIDILAVRPRERAVAVMEVKSDIWSTEEMHRVLDAKERLVPRIVEARFGWPPRIVGRVLVLPDEDRMRRLVARHEQTMASLYPLRGRELPQWLRRPSTPARGLWFISEMRDPNIAPAG